MRFAAASDHDWLNELIEYDVVRKDFEGLQQKEGASLLELVLLNAERLSVDNWLEWLTSGRGLIRLASVRADTDWISGLKLNEGLRAQLSASVVLPCFEASGTWVCAGLRMPRELPALEAQFAARIVVVAPTPIELRDAYMQYR